MGAITRTRTFDGRPVHQLAPTSAPGGWRALGDDPQILLLGPDEPPLAAGWYLLDTSIVRRDGVLRNACFYVDYGEGISEGTRIPLPLSAQPRQRIPVFFRGAVRGLRFDPSDTYCDFVLAPLRLRRLSGVEALLRIAVPEVRRARSAREPWSVILRNGLRAVRRGNVGRIAGETWDAYIRRAGSAANADYAQWIERCDRIDAAHHEAIAAAMSGFTRRPLISVLVPVYNTPEPWLRRCIDSVLAQIYPDWQLCIADDASSAPHVRRVLDEYVRRDARIAVFRRDRNGHIAAASNSALDLAKGEFIALLDHDDELREHALFHVAARLVQEPQLRLVYSDEDKIDETGRRFDPYFKPDWNPELLLGQNYVGHLCVYHTDLVRRLGGFREGFDGSQDYDLALRCSEHLEALQIGHIPKVLYHWRAISGSTARAGAEKSYPVEAGRRALREHLARRGIAAEVDLVDGAHYRVRRQLPATLPRISLIVPTRDRLDLLRTCVDSILARTDYPNYEIVIVDNQSVQPETLEYLASVTSDARVRVLRYHAPFNFSDINNYAVGQVESELVGLINNDIETIHAGWLSELVSHALQPDVGAVGAMLYYPDDTIQHAGVILGIGGVAGHAYPRRRRGYSGQMNRAHLAQNLSCVTAACLVIRRSIYQQVGGLDPALTVAFNDVDFCLRVREAGYFNVWTPFAELYHHESASRGYEDSPEKLARFHGEIAYMQRRWGEALQNDPAYNRNLTLRGDPFSLDLERAAPDFPASTIQVIRSRS